MCTSSWVEIHAPNFPLHDHLAVVRKEMEILGVPSIRAVWLPCGDWTPDEKGSWIAIEGSHRIAAAEELDMPIRIVPVEPSEIVYHDIQDVESPCTAGEIVEHLISYYIVTSYYVRAFVE